jgi:hypothetical protein
MGHLINSLFWIFLRSVAIPFVAILLLKETALGERGAVLAVGIALLLVTAVSIVWNGLKIVGNTLLLRGWTVIELILTIVVQLAALLVIWVHYFQNLN